MSIPAFSDIAKPSNDLLTRDFYHTASANLEVKSKAPNGVAFTVKGKNDHKVGAISGQIEAKYTDKSTGVTLTQAWTTTNALDTKIELDNTLAKGLKAEAIINPLPASKSKGAKLNIHFRQPLFHARGFFDILKGPSFTGDVVVGHDGFLAGAEVGYNVVSGSITRYSAAVGYSVPEYTAAITATNNLNLFGASYYHRVSAQVEAGAKATWDAKGGNASGVGLEIAGKYKLDSSAFFKAKINNQGIAALAYNQLLRPGVTLGLGASVDTQRLNESAAAHKLGLNFVFEA
ncbi:eukaryotic porin/Tom40 [Tuber indicum]|nr:eukaryotic porin/Tom40 [Tuber indicum]